MDILPAWMIEELKKIEEEKQGRRERRLHIELPKQPSTSSYNDNDDGCDDELIKIPLR